MSVATINPFALLDDEQDESPRQVAPVTKDAPAKKQAAPAATPAKTQAAPQPASKAAKSEGDSKPSRGRGAANGAPRGDGTRGGRGARGPRPERSNNFESAPAGEDGQEGRTNSRGGYRGGNEGQFGGRGRGRGGRGRGGRGRDFDRHPGNELKEGEKRQTIGKGNWGKEGQETEELTPAKSADELDQKSKDAEATATEASAPVEPSATADKEAAAAKEEEDKSKTLAQYKAELSRPAVELPPPRKAGEGTDDSKWRGTVVLEKSEEVYYAKDGGKKNVASKTSAPKDTPKKVSVEISFADEKPPRFSDRPNRGRGGFGSSRGGRGSSRGNGRDEAAPNVNDTSAFPSLG